MIAGAAMALLVCPAGAPAKPTSDRAQASKECKAERGHHPATREAFAAKYGTGSGKNAFGRCVSKKTREEAAERRKARSSASRACRAERHEMGSEAFTDKYGTGKRGKNAFGKCVSAKSRKTTAEQDQQDQEQAEATKNAAKECAAERDSLGEDAFGEKYGTNKNGKNAFGKCVSGKARDTYTPTQA
ncbi:MAG: hypothetical protein H0U84_05005 [Thermoleophilaceae bacterium]|nr:hypothetical protein [Thermoleophilaceae bacterium]